MQLEQLWNGLGCCFILLPALLAVNVVAAGIKRSNANQMSGPGGGRGVEASGRQGHKAVAHLIATPKIFDRAFVPQRIQPRLKARGFTGWDGRLGFFQVRSFSRGSRRGLALPLAG